VTRGARGPRRRHETGERDDDSWQPAAGPYPIDLSALPARARCRTPRSQRPRGPKSRVPGSRTVRRRRLRQRAAAAVAAERSSSEICGCSLTVSPVARLTTEYLLVLLHPSWRSSSGPETRAVRRGAHPVRRRRRRRAGSRAGWRFAPGTPTRASPARCSAARSVHVSPARRLAWPWPPSARRGRATLRGSRAERARRGKPER
jgi:hypothetical protein